MRNKSVDDTLVDDYVSSLGAFLPTVAWSYYALLKERSSKLRTHFAGVPYRRWLVFFVARSLVSCFYAQARIPGNSSR